MGIGDVIKKYRTLKHLTQQELAEKCGFKKVTIYQYEAGKRKPSFEKAAIIANALANSEEESDFIMEQFAKCFITTDTHQAKIDFYQQKMGALIRKYRKQKHMTQEQLSEKSHISLDDISRYESGEKTPSEDELGTLSYILDIESLQLIPDEFITAVENGDLEKSLEPDNLYLSVVKHFRLLNIKGMRKVNEYTNDISQIEEYRKDYKKK